MDFWSTVVGLLRRKWVIIPALVVALTLGAVAYLGTPSMYQSTTTMVLATTEYGGSESQDPADPTELSNPMLNFNDSLRTTAGILIEAMNTQDIATQLGAVGPNRLIVNDGRTNPDLLGLNGPFLYIVARATTPAQANRIVVDAQKLMRAKLRDWQTALNAPDKTFVSVVDVVPPSAPEPDRSRATKLGLLAFLFGFLLFMGIAYFRNQRRARGRTRAALEPAVVGSVSLDGRGLKRRRRRRLPSQGPAVVPDGEEVDAVPAGLDPVPLGDGSPNESGRSSVSPGTVPDEDDDDDLVPAMVSTPVRNGSESTVVATPIKNNAESAVVPTPLTKNAELAVVHAPVKLKVRSRNR
jgi:hypothetical protein